MEREMTEPFATVRFAESARSLTAAGILALCALIASLVAAPSAQAQQPAMTRVTLLTQDKGVVDAKPVAAKDIVAYVTARQAARSGLKMIELQTCPKVPPDMIQDMIKEEVHGGARHERAQCADLRRLTPRAAACDSRLVFRLCCGTLPVCMSGLRIGGGRVGDPVGLG
jgi:hypothetical protein